MSILDTDIGEVNDTAEKLDRIFDETAEQVVDTVNVIMMSNSNRDIGIYWAEIICTPHDKIQSIAIPLHIDIPLPTDKENARKTIVEGWGKWSAAQAVINSIESFTVKVDSIYDPRF